ncbi:MAG: VanZ family protein [Ancrocorticia sp.]|nr:VanZ family protein [Ancrocorticia sp.]MCI1964382.1 VanZ family protein [Ancrocorticia sp.]MCI2002985.1 VanZ family protein [Ancrocorticia sp.]MCI2013086.1 VanZ family protein [Ancrocorticia sp.]MCI2199301.1 VanZ family protein [Ancrocorticia sp.]
MRNQTMSRSSTADRNSFHLAVHQWVGLFGFALSALAMLIITLRPERVDDGMMPQILHFLAAAHAHGLPGWFGYRDLEFTANVAMVMPLGFFAGLALSPGHRWIPAIGLPLLSAGVELTQLLALPERVASVSDVVANSLGAWLGLAVAAALFRHN